MRTQPTSFTVTRLNRVDVQLDWVGTDSGLEISLFRSEIPGDFKSAERITSIAQSGLTVEDNGRRRFFYCLRSGDNEIWAAERRIPMEGLVNFRDLGGYASNDGRCLKWGALFRGDSLQRASDRDLEKIRELEIGVVFDFRRDEEVKKGPDRFPEGHPIQYHHLPITHGEFNFMTALEKLKKGSADWIREETIIRGYIDNTVNYATTWGDVIRQIVAEGCPPVFFHCTAGKDRTGICAALILSALGIPREIIMADYLLSNPFIHEVWLKAEKSIRDQGVDPKKLEPFFSAPANVMQSLLSHLDQEFGSVNDFLQRKAGIDQDIQAALKHRLLE